MAETSFPPSSPVRWLCRVRIDGAVVYYVERAVYWITARDAACARYQVDRADVEAWRVGE